jgi:type II secretory pathway component GspD/PulD (secretin)
MLFQKDTLVNHKLPLLGDLPLVGGLFQHNSAEQSNSELIVFVTPFVIDEGQEMSEEAKAEIEGKHERLEDVQAELEATRQMLEEKMEDK